MLRYVTTIACMAATALSLPATMPAMPAMSGMTGIMSMMTSPKPGMTIPSEPCCLPLRYQGSTLDLKSNESLQYITIFAHDFNKKIEGSFTMDRKTDQILYQSFTDYNTMIQYGVPMLGDMANKCTQNKVTTDIIGGCIHNLTGVPITYEYVGSAKIGGDMGIMYDGWNMKGPSNLEGTVALSRGTCIPLLESVRMDTPTGHMDSLFLINDVTTNVDPMILSMPAACMANFGVAIIG